MRARAVLKVGIRQQHLDDYRARLDLVYATDREDQLPNLTRVLKEAVDNLGDAEADLAELDARFADPRGFPPDPKGAEVLGHAVALFDLIGSRSPGARTARWALRGARLGGLVRRPRGRRPAGRPRARATARASRAGPRRRPK